MQDVYYFGAGPAALPKSVINNIKHGLEDFRGSGLSVLELSHRSNEFFEIQNHAVNLLKELMAIPDNYEVLLLHGGATAQYSMLPINFLATDDTADYVCTGHWSYKASEEAKKYADINVIDALENSDSITIKPQEDWALTKQSKYIHYCDNETINGVVNNAAELNFFKSKRPRFFCDMTSSILTRPIQVNDYALIYASAQKNLGVAGLCVMVVKKELLESEQVSKNNIPRVYDYKRCFENNSLTNTPPTFAIYVLGLMLSWLKAEGGVNKIHKRMQPKVQDLYSLIDASEIYENNVGADFRSMINIPFDVKDEALQTKFLRLAEKENLLGLRGHKSVGGVRVSLYNAMSQHGVDKLLGFMRDFESSHA